MNDQGAVVEEGWLHNGMFMQLMRRMEPAQKKKPKNENAMKILLFSDIHGDVPALERIVAQPADLYIDVADLATFSRGLEKCGEVLKPLGGKLWVLPGNHESHDESRALC